MANEPSSPASASPANPVSPALGPQARGEARVFDLSKLLPSQREAVRSAQDLVARMAEKTYSPRPRRSHEDLATALRVNIDPDRESRALLLDGPRGSGKTSALLTLLQGWGDSSLLSRSAPGTGYTSPEPSPPSPETISNPRGRIVPVGIIDLQPLADGTNLLQLIASHFAHIVDAIDGIGSHSDAPPSLAAAWQGGLSREPESRRLWRKLIATIAGGFDRSLQGRAAQLDLEAYALEFEQQGRHRLDLDVFYDFIEALLGDLCTRLGRNRSEAPLFVLAIDDADMAPQRSVELLWTVRALWHPRCVFILTGHSDLFQLQLRQHYIGELLRPIGHRPVPSQDQDEIARHATTMASEAYEKIIPPNQRLLIRPLEPSQRLTWPLQRGSRSDGNTSTLLQLLGQIRVPTYGSEPLTLADYFQIDDETTAQLAEALPERPRRLLDLSLQLEALAARQKAAPRSEPGQATPDELRPTSEAILAIWETALLSTDPIRFDKLRRQVRLDPKTGALIVGTTDPRQQLEGPLTPELQLVRELDAYPVPETEGGRVAVQIYRLAQLTARLVSRQALPAGAANQVLEADQGHELGAALVAALRLAANVAADQLRGRREATSWAPTDAGLRTWLAAGAYADNEREVRFAWPLPDDLSFVDLAVLDLRWKRLLTQSPKANRQWLLFSFIRIILETYDDAEIFKPSLTQESDPGATISSMVRVCSLGKGDIRRRRILADWVQNSSALLFAPEIGVYDIMFSHHSAFMEIEPYLLHFQNALKDLRDRQIASAQRLTGVIDPGTKLRYIQDTVDAQFHRWRAYIRGISIDIQENYISRLHDTLQALGLSDNMDEHDLHRVLFGIDEFETWNNHLAFFQHSQILRILSLWQNGCAFYQEKQLASCIQLENTALKIVPLPGVILRKEKSHNSTQLGSSVSGVCQCEFEHELPSRLDATHPLPILYRATWDLLKSNFDDTPPIVTGQYWPGYFLDTRLKQGIPLWPHVRFRHFKQAKTLITEWNSVIAKTPFSNPYIPAQYWHDTLAFWFIEEQISVILRQPPPQPELMIASDAWTTLVINLAKKTDVRLEAWRPLFPLYASPESGLSHIAVAGILSGLSNTSGGQISPSELQRIQQLRINRLLSADLEEPAAKRLLTEIDDANPDHPYVALLRQHGVSL